MKRLAGLVVATLFVGACSSDELSTEQVDTNGDGVVSSEEANAAGSQISLIDLKPGLYRGSSVDTSGASESETQSEEMCITKEQAEEKPDFTAPEGCVYEKFDIRADALSTVLKCTDASRATDARTYRDQTYSPTKYTTKFRYEDEIGSGNYSFDAVTERIGECPAG